MESQRRPTLLRQLRVRPELVAEAGPYDSRLDLDELSVEDKHPVHRSDRPCQDQVRSELAPHLGDRRSRELRRLESEFLESLVNEKEPGGRKQPLG